jgi:putative ABC transport system substrate-binding protein
MEHGAKREQPQRLTSKVLVPAALGAMLFALCSVAEAQQAKKIPRLGLLIASSPSPASARIEAFRHGLRELGYVEGKNIVIEYRYAEGKPDRLPALAAELLCFKIDIIVTGVRHQPVPPKKQQLRIPIVMTQDVSRSCPCED